MTVYTAAEITDGDVVMIPKALYDEWVAVQDEALNWADANARWFDISTAPWLQDVDSEYDYRSPDSGNGIGQVYKTDLFDDALGEWLPDVHVGDVLYKRNGAVSKPTHWRPIQNPPLGQLAEPLERLGEVLRRIKGVGWTGGKSNAPSRYVAPVTALASARKMVIKNGE